MTKDKNDLFKGQGRFVEMPESLCKMVEKQTSLTITPEDVERCANVIAENYDKNPIVKAQAVLNEFVKGKM